MITLKIYNKPIIFHVSLIDILTQSDLDKFFTNILILYKYQFKFYLLLDLTKKKHIPINLLFQFIKFMKKNNENNRLYLYSTGILIKNQLIMYLINLAFSIVKPVRPYKISKSIDILYDFFTL